MVVTGFFVQRKAKSKSASTSRKLKLPSCLKNHQLSVRICSSIELLALERHRNWTTVASQTIHCPHVKVLSYNICN